MSGRSAAARAGLAGLLVATATAFVAAQARAPKADVAATPAALSAAPGTTVKATLTIKLPEDIHVQSDKPRDPLLIATALTLTPPNGIALDHIVYPKPTDLVQPGRKEPLAVFSGTFTIDAFLRVSAETPPGDMTLPAQLRYQACNDTVCFVPARADVQWTLHVTAH